MSWKVETHVVFKYIHFYSASLIYWNLLAWFGRKNPHFQQLRSPASRVTYTFHKWLWYFSFIFYEKRVSSAWCSTCRTLKWTKMCFTVWHETRSDVFWMSRVDRWRRLSVKVLKTTKNVIQCNAEFIGNYSKRIFFIASRVEYVLTQIIIKNNTLKWG